MSDLSSDILWSPSSQRILDSNLVAFAKFVENEVGLAFGDYSGLYDWSVAEPEEFWSTFWDYAGIIGEKGSVVVDDVTKLPGARWFPEGAINAAEIMLQGGSPTEDQAAKDALVFWGEDKVKRRVTLGELCDQVARARAALLALGVTKGDRVAGYLPNMPETIIAMLASASIGAIWSSASPDFGVQGVLDRFGQIAPKVLLVVDGYHYNGKTHDCLDKAAGVAKSLPEDLVATVIIPYAGGTGDPAKVTKGLSWADFLAKGAPADAPAPALTFERLPLDHPLYVMFSSGTTGVPKCIIHGHGVLLQQLKEHILHSDARPGDKVFYFTTCGWMMWNWLVAALGARCTLMLYDGAPSYPSGNILFDFADAEGCSFLGTSAKWIDAIAKAGLRPKDTHNLSTVRIIASTGSPLVPESFDYVYEAIKEDVQLASISGGTDLLSCFMLGSPWDPVR
ncbi:MAG: acetoacetate--CoA ligase, partial [Rhodospirillaceae bacterium]